MSEKPERKIISERFSQSVSYFQKASCDEKQNKPSIQLSYLLKQTPALRGLWSVRQGVLLLLLLLSPGPASAVQGLKASVQGQNFVMTWPSQPGQTFIIQRRETLDTPWITVQANWSSSSGTSTTFVVGGVVLSGNGGGGGGAGGSGGPPAPSSMQSSGETQKVKKEKKPKNEEEEFPPLPWDPSTHKDESPPSPGMFSSMSGGSETANVSYMFYRVVRNGVTITGTTNGAKVSGTIKLPIELSLPTTPSSVSVTATNGSPIDGLSMEYLESGMRVATWDTTSVPNGTYYLKAVAAEGESADFVFTESSTMQLQVTNAVWFPFSYYVAGHFLPVIAQSIHKNGIYHLSITDDLGMEIFEEDGLTDSEGYIRDPQTGSIGILLDNHDEDFVIFDPNFYTIRVTTAPAPGPLDSSPSGTTGNKVIPVEKDWPKASAFTKFTIGYQPYFGNPVGGSGPQVTLQSMIQVIYAIAATRDGGVAEPGSDQAPNEIYNRPDFVTWSTDYFRRDGIRNLYYFGHGAPDYLGTVKNHGGTKPQAGTLTITDLTIILKNNIADPLQGTNRHP